MVPADPSGTGALADRLIGTGASPGAVVALTDRGRLLGVVTRGHADPAAGRPVDADTAFQIGSISKSFTAICLLREVEHGRLSLDGLAAPCANSRQAIYRSFGWTSRSAGPLGSTGCSPTKAERDNNDHEQSRYRTRAR